MPSFSLAFSYVFLVFISIANGADDQNVIKNKGVLHVQFGGKTVLTKSVLKIKPHSRESRCHVMVSYDEIASTTSVGRLHPSTFPCNYREGDVYYVHYGAPVYNASSVRLLVTYISEESELKATSMTLNVQTLPANYTIVSRNLGLKVSERSRFSQPISTSVLSFSYDKVTQDCRVTLRDTGSSWPRYVTPLLPLLATKLSQSV